MAYLSNLGLKRGLTMVEPTDQEIYELQAQFWELGFLYDICEEKFSNEGVVINIDLLDHRLDKVYNFSKTFNLFNFMDNGSELEFEFIMEIYGQAQKYRLNENLTSSKKSGSSKML